MVKERLDLRIIACLPLGIPPEIQRFDEGENVSVDIFEVGDVCPIGWDILDMAVDLMLSLSAIGQLADEATDIDHGEDGLFEELLDSVDPDIDIAVHLLDWIFSQW